MHLRVFEKSDRHRTNPLFESEISRSFRIGRQEPGEQAEISLFQDISGESDVDLKLVIASKREREYSRNFVEVLFGEDRVEVRNTSSKQMIFVDATPVGQQESRLGSFPVEITLVDRTICILQEKTNLDVTGILSLAAAPSPPGLITNLSPEMSLAWVGHKENLDEGHLLELLQTMLQIFQDSPNRPEYFSNAANAMVQLLELDHVLIAFLPEHLPVPVDQQQESISGWHTQAKAFKGRHDPEWAPSLLILKTILAEKKTVYQIPEDRTESLMRVNCLVASPLLNSENDVIGVVYGDRGMTTSNRMSFGETEAKFVELFASGVSAGLARLGQECKLATMRSRFDQFFFPDLARRLESDDSMLEPRSAEVSVLFADIRGFSRISEKIGPEQSIRWINFVMSELSECVFDHGGVVVDYFGDEVMAMWGAPVEQNNHAELAVRAGLDMIGCLPKINERWESIIGEPFEIGIGVNSGEAQVGNTGSDQRFKYGPLGDVVNVSSRIQGATKQLKARLLITEATSTALSKEIVRRKIRSVRFVNVQRAVTVYEIPFCPDDKWIELKNEYEAGLAHYEAGELALASQKLAAVINQFSDDGPSMMLLADSVGSLQNTGAEFDPVWQLDQK